jgi:hypothetical protein
MPNNHASPEEVQVADSGQATEQKLAAPTQGSYPMLPSIPPRRDHVTRKIDLGEVLPVSLSTDNRLNRLLDNKHVLLSWRRKLVMRFVECKNSTQDGNHNQASTKVSRGLLAPIKRISAKHMIGFRIFKG